MKDERLQAIEDRMERFEAEGYEHETLAEWARTVVPELTDEVRRLRREVEEHEIHEQFGDAL